MIKQISRAEVQGLVSKGALLIEVLPASGFREEHLPHAINIPLQQLHRERVAEFKGDLPIIAYCFDAL